ncbi:NAD-dependent epimerase/dehydratase family protein [Nitrospirillum amazonense]|uniref:NAD-dependent epimerase/dehydratase family protein n=1 Tax=Nitrospirillum amazonense TaxID=28077 RepID=UPI002DD43814|nr:NAD-dependent epimerase/dehydratase family protein [Nitrospirillum amazonense]MEC4593123.1 NAD-dependent epimerase/dehydratase family protein [Nitrospirillum amazonense]
MKVILFGATGMVGQGVMRECLHDPRVTQVLAVGRTATGLTHAKLSELTLPAMADPGMTDWETLDGLLAGYDACFFCLGVSSSGMTEDAYTRITHGLTLEVARTLARLNSGMTFIYVSGSGTDGTERGRTMWARVKGRTENDLRRLPFKAVYLFRPGLIPPLHGARSKTSVYRLFYTLTAPLLPLARRLFPNQVLTTVEIGQAMLNAAERGAPQAVLETADIRRVVA